MESIRKEFPILHTLVRGKPLIYFDNAASTQKPIGVIRAISEYYENYNSNIHRGAHYLANKATEAYEQVRLNMAQFLGVEPREILFTSGTTQSINLLAQSWGRKFLKRGDTIILSEMEHHANLVPWIALSEEIGFRIEYIPMTEEGILNLSALDELFSKPIRLLSIAHTSNALGTVHPIQDIVKKAKDCGALVHIDVAQAIQHSRVEIHKLEIDFLSFSSHKMYGPMGVGIFWGKEEHLLAMNPYLFGGEMIREVFLDRVIYNELPYKFEAGTPNVADVIGLGAALELIQQIGIDKIQQHEKELQTYLWEQIERIPFSILYTPKDSSAAVVSFNVEGIHPYDLGQMLDAKGIAIRTGHHCCQPLMRKLGIEGTCRASIAIYNTIEEIDSFAQYLSQSIDILR